MSSLRTVSGETCQYQPMSLCSMTEAENVSAVKSLKSIAPHPVNVDSDQTGEMSRLNNAHVGHKPGML